MRAFERSVLAFAVAALFAAPALATNTPKSPSLDLAQAMELIAKTYPGRVISGQTDASGGDATHHQRKATWIAA